MTTRMMIALAVAGMAMFCLVGCCEVVSLDELIAKTHADCVNSAHSLMYCGEENGLEYFRHESALPLVGGDYAVSSSELPANDLRFPRTSDTAKWKVVMFERTESVVNGVPAKGVIMRETWPLAQLKKSIRDFADSIGEKLGEKKFRADPRFLDEEQAVCCRLLQPIKDDAKALAEICAYAVQMYEENEALTSEHETPRQWFYSDLEWTAITRICELGDFGEFKRLQSLYGTDGGESLLFKHYEEKYFRSMREVSTEESK